MFAFSHPTDAPLLRGAIVLCLVAIPIVLLFLGLGRDFVYTDVWVSMGEPEEIWAERIAQLSPYTVTQAVIGMTGNPHTKFLHCLPAFHNHDTKTGEAVFQTYGLPCMEVTEEVFESPASRVFDRAENRLHAIKSVLVAKMGA